jgi:hypothetical protein
MRKALLVAALGLAVSAGAAADTRFEISYPSSANAGPLTAGCRVITRTLAARAGECDSLYGAMKGHCYSDPGPAGMVADWWKQ